MPWFFKVNCLEIDFYFKKSLQKSLIFYFNILNTAQTSISCNVNMFFWIKDGGCGARSRGI